MPWEHSVLERKDVFRKNIGIRVMCFKRMEVFLQNMGNESSNLFVKIGNKGHPFDFFRPWNSVVLTECTFFDQIGAWQQGGVFRHNLGTRTVTFPWKIWKERHPIDFLGPKYIVVLIELTFFLIKYGIGSRGFCIKNLRKIPLDHSFFLENGRFLTKYDLESSVFLEKTYFW